MARSQIEIKHRMRDTNKNIFWLVGLQHCAYGVLLCAFPVEKVTAIANMGGGVVPPAVLGLSFFIVGLLAIRSIYARTMRSAMLLIVWQQLFLFVSLANALICSFHGKYPDETVCDGMHIFTDQLVYLLIAFFHLKAVIETHGGKSWTR